MTVMFQQISYSIISFKQYFKLVSLQTFVY